MLGYGEYIIIGIVALLFFCSRQPEVARSLGRALGEFKRSVNENITNDPPPQSSQSAPSPQPPQSTNYTSNPGNPSDTSTQQSSQGTEKN